MIRPVMATTILLGLPARAWGLPGRAMVMGVLEGSLRLCRLRVLSQDAETRMPQDLLYTTRRTGAVCLLSAVNSPVSRLRL